MANGRGRSGGRSAYDMMPAIRENALANNRDNASNMSGSTDNKGDKLGRIHRVESLKASFVRESNSGTLLPGMYRNAVKNDEDNVGW